MPVIRLECERFYYHSVRCVFKNQRHRNSNLWDTQLKDIRRATSIYYLLNSLIISQLYINILFLLLSLNTCAYWVAAMS